MLVPGATFTPRRQFGTGAPPASPFPTTWPNTENPVSLGGAFTAWGKTTGLLWNDPQSTGGTPGIAFCTASSPTDDTDNIAVVGSRFSTTKHYSQITINQTVGYTPPSTQEVECLTGFTIVANSASGYEMDCGFGLSVQPVRWNGGLNNFDVGVFTTLSGATFTYGDGDVIKVVFDSTSGSPVITLFKNTVQMWQITDTTAGKIVSGSPGLGFFARPGTGLDFTKYCSRGFDCGNA